MHDAEHAILADAYSEHLAALYTVFGITAAIIFDDEDGSSYSMGDRLPGPPHNGRRLRGVLEGGVFIEAYEWGPRGDGLDAPRVAGRGGWKVDLYRWDLIDVCTTYESRAGQRRMEHRLCPVIRIPIQGDDRTAQGLVDTVKAALRLVSAAA